ncbi:DUF6531 domain-containing protein [Microbulbifer sp. OS29]|uniref:DUF6531 domain-containing protein n=1 Tax=Microbulbifer okhotskensis TaxID=2926617 RepID=A0A9X2J7H7_9GAMM|nr:RHS repeat-associated core domain-containing protein [Microbulbifer okhotskensis]MCO1335790.1 DUF6531 domain-containing protein [Microbulbifer okhotskensis]
MQLFIENSQGIRYAVRVGWAYQADIPERVNAIELLEMFDDRVLQQIYDHFLSLQSVSAADSDAGQAVDTINRLLLTPQMDVPGYLNQRDKSIYCALMLSRLVIEEAFLPLSILEDLQAEFVGKIRVGLQKIIVLEGADTTLVPQRQEKHSGQEKVGTYIDGGAKRVGQPVWEPAIWPRGLVEVVAMVQPVRQFFKVAAVTANYVIYDKKLETLGKERLSLRHKTLLNALGFESTSITKQQLQLAFNVAEVIYDEPALRDTILQFAKDYIKAQHGVEVIELTDSGTFEIILTVMLVTVTGGTKARVSLVKNTRLVKDFFVIGDLMLNFAKLNKQLKLLSEKRGGKTRGSGSRFSALSGSSTESPFPSTSFSSSSSTNLGPGSSSQAGNRNSISVSNGAQGRRVGGSSITAQPSEPDKTNSDTGENQNGDSSQCNANACEGGERINLKTGEERLTLIDTVLDGPLSLTLARTYRSSNARDLGLGHGWTHTLNERLVWRPGKPVQFHDAEGRVISLPTPGDSGRSHNVVEQLTLTRVNDEHWIISPYGAPNGVQKHFKATGDKGALKLAEIRDGYGNDYLFHYIDERLICIESSIGEALHISPPEGQASSHRIGELKKETRDGRIKVLAQYEYSDEGDLIKATDADGHCEQYQYHQHVIKQRTLKTGYRFHFEWDAEGPAARCTRQWGDPIGGQGTYNYQFTWDDDGKGVTVTDTRGGQERYRFNERALPIYHRDPEGAETLYSYNDLGQVTKVLLPSDDGSLREEIYHYDEQGRLSQKTDASGNRHRIEYNREGLPAKVTDPAGNSWQRRYNKNGQIVGTEDPLGNSTQYGYNPVGLIGSVTDPLGNATRYLWNPEGKLAAVKDPMGRTQHYRYDGTRRLAEVQHAPGQSTRYEYDAQDRIHAVTTPDCACTQYSYNPQGLLAEVTDSEGRSTCYVYDGLSQVKTRTNPDGSRLEYHYDGERNLVGLISENGERYQLKYDLNERLIEEVGFDGRVTRYAYNRAGHLVSSRAVTDTESGKGIDTLFERDPFGRLLEEITPDGITNFRYNRSGQLIEAENTHRKLRWEYDANGRITTDWQGKDKLSHQYDAAGNRIASTLPDGEVLNFAFNPAGQFQSLHRRPVGSDTDQLIIRISHDEQGRESQRQHGNGLESQRDYDSQGRLQKLRLGKTDEPVSGPTQSSILERSYQYNKAGQIAKIEDSLHATRSDHYDALDRLTQVNGPNPEQFVHDPAHNILAAASSKGKAKQQANTTETKGNRLAFRGDTHYRYDIKGNRIAELRGKGQKLQTRYHYNSRQQLVRVEKIKAEKGTEQFQQVVHYQYDPLGRRIGKVNNREKVDFLWDENVLLQESKTDFQSKQTLNTRTYYFEPSTFKPVALKESTPDSEQVYHYHLDHLGMPDTLTNQEGEVVWRVAYQGYGHIFLVYENQIEQPIRFQGQYLDAETGLLYSRFRYYDPLVGEFTQQDSIGLRGGGNNYQYAPNPLVGVAPYGLTCKEGIAGLKISRSSVQGYFAIEANLSGSGLIAEQQSAEI